LNDLYVDELFSMWPEVAVKVAYTRYQTPFLSPAVVVDDQ
jgi:hypothetical protein